MHLDMEWDRVQIGEKYFVKLPNYLNFIPKWWLSERPFMNFVMLCKSFIKTDILEGVFSSKDDQFLKFQEYEGKKEDGESQ